MNTIKITFTDSVRSGISAKGNAYNLQEAFIHVADKPFPLQCNLLVDSVVRPADYLVPYSIGVNNGRPELMLKLESMKLASNG
jgi:hypothetical protein